MSDRDALAARWATMRRERRYSRLAPSTLRAALWALRAVNAVRRDLRRSGLAAHVAPPPPLPWGSRTGVDGVLNRLDPTCLERCLVQQAWYAHHGMEHDVIIGVKSGSPKSMAAHAWLEHLAAPSEHMEYTPIHRLPPA